MPNQEELLPFCPPARLSGNARVRARALRGAADGGGRPGGRQFEGRERMREGEREKTHIVFLPTSFEGRPRRRRARSARSYSFGCSQLARSLARGVAQVIIFPAGTTDCVLPSTCCYPRTRRGVPRLSPPGVTEPRASLTALPRSAPHAHGMASRPPPPPPGASRRRRDG